MVCDGALAFRQKAGKRWHGDTTGVEVAACRGCECGKGGSQKRGMRVSEGRKAREILGDLG